MIEDQLGSEQFDSKVHHRSSNEYQKKKKKNKLNKLEAEAFTYV